MVGSTPLTYWIGFHAMLLLALGIELTYARRTKSKKKAIVVTLGWIVVALAFGAYIAWSLGKLPAQQFFAGYAIEESLSIDNLFVFLLLFRVFGVVGVAQRKVLFWGVTGAVILRGLFIAAGLGLLARFSWISYVFAAILLIAAIRLLIPEDESKKDEPPFWMAWLRRISPVSSRTDHFFVIENGKRVATLLLISLIAIELTDVVFALDSIPAVLSITRHPFLAYTSNVMAVMGLRTMFFVLADLLERIRFLHYGLAAVLIFAAIKMLIAHWFEIPAMASLGVILALLGITIAASLLAPRPGKA